MKILILIIAASFLASCSTSYQRNGFSGGYDDIKLASDMYQVTFRGNGYTGSDNVQKMFLRRCADLTIENGYDYFIIMDQESGSTQTQGPTTYNGTIQKNYYGGYQTSGTASSYSVNRHSRTGVIKMFKRDTQPQIAYEAAEIMKSTGP